MLDSTQTMCWIFVSEKEHEKIDIASEIYGNKSMNGGYTKTQVHDAELNRNKNATKWVESNLEITPN